MYALKGSPVHGSIEAGDMESPANHVNSCGIRYKVAIIRMRISSITRHNNTQHAEHNKIHF